MDSHKADWGHKQDPVDPKHANVGGFKQNIPKVTSEVDTFQLPQPCDPWAMSSMPSVVTRMKGVSSVSATSLQGMLTIWSLASPV